jgi:hypothetical protein
MHLAATCNQPKLQIYCHYTRLSITAQSLPQPLVHIFTGLLVKLDGFGDAGETVFLAVDDQAEILGSESVFAYWVNELHGLWPYWIMMDLESRR